MNFRSLLVCSLLGVCSLPLAAQSTYGTILGTVKDSSGGTLSGAIVTATNIDKNEDTKTASNASGQYELLNLLPAHYRLTVTATGFDTYSATGLLLEARQSLRVDANMQVGQVSQTITVNDTEAGIIDTTNDVIAATFTPKQLLDLPANVRAAGNTSPYNFLQVLPGVQADNKGNFSIQGGIPSQTQYSVDGISTTDVTGNGPLQNAFPSSESISEIKVQGVGSPAEYGQIGDVTTVSKSGTNELHGALFWYAQNAALNAINYGSLTKPKLIANDFGVTVGGPVVIPHLYNGKNRTFFYGTYEGFRYPKSTTVQDTVPTEAERNGNFSAEGVTVIDPTTGKPFPNDTIPSNRINSVAQKVLTLYPLPNAGETTSVHEANYIVNKNTSYHSDQYDVRVDQYLNSKQSIFARWTDKNIGSLSTQDLLIPSNNNPDIYHLFVFAYNYSITPALYNEARFGFTINNSGYTNPFNGAAFSASLGLQGLIGLPAFFNGLPEFDINNLTGLTADRLEGISHSRTFQGVDNVSYNKGKHVVKFGLDIRHVQAVDPLGFIGGDNYGNFSFNGSFTNSPFGDFLLGLPNQTGYDDVNQDNNGSSNHYNAYVQDSFRVNTKLTLDFGLRFEFHPGYTDASGNIGNFNPNIKGSGEVIYPDGAAGLLATGFLQSANACPVYGTTTGPSLNGVPCMPVLSASQANLPNSLRTAPRRFMPRFGFAYTPFGNKTVFRGGFSMYNTEVLGSIYYALTGTLQSATYSYNNSLVNGVPAITLPNVKTGGSGITVPPAGTDYFGTANQINYKDPYTMQWNFSIDHDLGFNTGLRVSYIGSGTRDLVWAPNLNQSYYSTTPYVDQPLASRPFPNWGIINTRANGANSNYESGQVELNHRYKNGLTLNTAYTFAKALADNAGYATDGFAGENAGARTLDALDLKHEYGPVSNTRKHRWVSSFTYELPVGRGRQFLGGMNRFEDAVIGGWQLSSIFVLQTGPYLTPYFSGGDPSGTGSGVIGRQQAPDRIGNSSLSNPTANDWFNAAAYTCPGTPGWTVGTACLIGSGESGALNPIGRFGTAGIGTVIGPGTVNLNAGLSKRFAFTEKVSMKIEGTFTNVLNHVNLADPVLAIDNPSVGQITSARSQDFGGSRTGQVGARIDF